MAWYSHIKVLINGASVLSAAPFFHTWNYI